MASESKPRASNVRRANASIRIGVGGWTYAPWRETFYPDDLAHKRELEYASRRFTSIEINSTYYGAQSPATFRRWREATPPGFVFAVKAPRAATNRRQLADAADSIRRFVRGGVLELREKLGPINWQLPPTKRFDAGEIDAFLGLLPTESGGMRLRHAIEARHVSFDRARFLSLARKHGVAVVLAGDSTYPCIADEKSPFLYARVMGTISRLKKGYTARALDAWASSATEWARSGRDVFLYFISGAKERNPAAAMALMDRIG